MRKSTLQPRYLKPGDALPVCRWLNPFSHFNRTVAGRIACTSTQKTKKIIRCCMNRLKLTGVFQQCQCIIKLRVCDWDFSWLQTVKESTLKFPRNSLRKIERCAWSWSTCSSQLHLYKVVVSTISKVCWIMYHYWAEGISSAIFAEHTKNLRALRKLSSTFFTRILASQIRNDPLSLVVCIIS